jgi:uncharacterized protein YndB with AHSA1/START domain
MTPTRTTNGPIGTVRPVAGAAAVRVEDTYATDVDDLWSAVTEPARLARWVAQVEGDLRPGGRFTATFTSGWEGEGRVDVCEAPGRLLLTMSPGTAEETVIEVELTTEGDRTRLVVEERGIPLDEAAAHGAGWQVHAEDLAAHVAGRATADWRTRWAELAPAYARPHPSVD